MMYETATAHNQNKSFDWKREYYSKSLLNNGFCKESQKNECYKNAFQII